MPTQKVNIRAGVEQKSNGTTQISVDLIKPAGTLPLYVDAAESVLETIKLAVDASHKGKYAIHLRGKVEHAAELEVAAKEEAKKATGNAKAAKEAAATAATASRVKLETEYKQVQKQAEDEVIAVVKKLEEEKENQSIKSRFKNTIGEVIKALKIVGDGLLSPFRGGGKRHTNKHRQKKTHTRTHKR